MRRRGSHLPRRLAIAAPRFAVLDKTAPGGGLGQKVAAAVGTDPQRQLDDALRRFKQVLETGEVIRSEGSPEGTDAKQQRKQRPAEPVAPTSSD
jgi:hypothetical protein